MNEDQMKLDPNILDLFVVWIDKYAHTQTDLLNEYLSKMNSLSSEWDDPNGYNAMLETLNKVIKNSNSAIEHMRRTYRKFYYDEALEIRDYLKSMEL